MAFEVTVPKWGMTMEEGVINQWLKQQGEHIEKDEPLVEIETEKVANVVESPASGIVARILEPAGNTVPVGQIIAVITEPGEAVPDTESASPTKSASAKPIVQANEQVNASPLVKKLAVKLGVDLKKITGSGSEGRILSGDVEKYAASASAGPTDPAEPVAGTIVELTKMRRAIGANLQSSSHEKPHFNVTISINMNRAMEVREQLNQSRDKEHRVSVNDLVVRACAVALQQYPAVNSRLEDNKINYLADINIGIATTVSKGLVVPVVTGADKLSWYELADEAKRIAQQARNGKVIGMGKGTFTVSNLGMFGVENFTAIINPPESAILAVGAVKNEAVDIGGDIGLQPMMKVTLCSDHRVVDGTLAAQLLNCIKVYLEEQITADE